MLQLSWIRCISTKRLIHTDRWLPWEDKILKDYVEHNGKQWTKIVQHCLPHRSPRQCQGRWSENLRPNLKKGPFSEEERKLLTKAIEKIGVGRWSEISERYLPHRSSRRIANEWSNQSQALGGWTAEEDQLILRGVQEYGLSAWSSIARDFLPHRNRTGIRARYQNRVAPNISTQPWSEHELDLLLRRTIIYGQDWNKVAAGIQNRPPEQCRAKWMTGIDPSLNKEPWSSSEERLFLEHLIENQGSLFKASNKMPGRNRILCHTKWLEILRDPELNALYGSLLARTSDENKPEWRTRVARLACQWLDSELTLKPAASGGFHMIKQGRWDHQERAALEAAFREHPHDWETIAQRVGRSPVQCRRQHEVQTYGTDSKSVPWSAEEDKQLLDAMAIHGYNWRAISTHVSQRTPIQCASRWSRVLQYPESDSRPLSESEKSLVWEGYQMFGPNWQAIQKTYLPSRRPHHLMRWWNARRPKENDDFCKQPWTEAEENTLRFAIQQSTTSGKIHWPLVAKMMQERTAKECRVQWQTKLDPALKKGPWESDEKMRMVELVQKHKLQKNQGSFWPLVAQELGTGRSEHACRCAYSAMQRKGSRFAT